MNSVTNAILRLEEGDYQTQGEAYSDLQRAINSGSAWSLQGSFGRSMMEAIETGKCMLGRSPARDYWGNRIPSRTEVQEGTKGSRQFVVDRMGEPWAEILDNVDSVRA